MENSGFFDRVYEVVRKIPSGRATSYGAIAKYLGMPRSARMVGWAMNASHLDAGIPAHRVVNRRGLLTGKHHFKGTNLMQQLLENEGIRVRDNVIIDFAGIFWDPMKELDEQ
jgi:methylated-DNA-protein-cysteine methyltransferase-like protein